MPQAFEPAAGRSYLAPEELRFLIDFLRENAGGPARGLKARPFPSSSVRFGTSRRFHSGLKSAAEDSPMRTLPHAQHTFAFMLVYATIVLAINLAVGGIVFGLPG
jgi:hypothetical protein